MSGVQASPLRTQGLPPNPLSAWITQINTKTTWRVTSTGVFVLPGSARSMLGSWVLVSSGVQLTSLLGVSCLGTEGWE